MLSSNFDKNCQGKGFLTPPATWRTNQHAPAMPGSEKKPRRSPQAGVDLFHVIHKVPAGDSPYVRAKHVQLIDKDPSKAISLFWSAINAGDRVDSALKDMAIVMKQLHRSDEAIEAIKSFRHLCPAESQESLDNVLIELYKKSGRIEEEIEMLQLKLRHIEEGIAFGGKQTKMARSQGKKINITIEKEYSRLLGNLAWAYVQKQDYKSAEESYRKALSLEPDKNKQCNLAICLMHMNKITEARFLLRAIRLSAANGQMDESYAKSYERAAQMMDEIESKSTLKPVAREKEIGKEVQTPITNRNLKGAYWFSTGQMEMGSACKKTYTPPFPSGGIPRAPYTQPRQTSWLFNKGDQSKGSLAEWKAGDCSRKLTFEQPTYNNSVLFAAENGQDKVLQLPTIDMAKPVQLVSERHCNPREKPFDGDFNCNTNSLTRESEGGLKVIAEHTLEDLKSVQQLDANLKPPLGFSMHKSKKSWADMAEEEEQVLQSGISSLADQASFSQCQELFESYQTPSKSSDCWADAEEVTDENIDSNIKLGPIALNQPNKVIEMIESSDLGARLYYTQPRNAASPTSQAVRRTLCFDKDQKPDRADSYCPSPLGKKSLNFDSDASMLSEGCRSSNGIKLLRRNRLQVFRELTPESPRP